MRCRWVRGAVALGTLALATPAPAQVLEPRLYSNAPTGLNAVAFGYSYSIGSLEFDASTTASPERARARAAQTKDKKEDSW